MSRILNGVPPEDAARYRRAIQLGDITLATQPKLRGKSKAAKVRETPMVEPRCSMLFPLIEIDVPLYWDTQMHNTNRLSHWVKESYAKAHHEAVWGAWERCRLDTLEEDSVKSMEFIRLGPGNFDKKDNLRAACKYIVDAVCSRLVHGPNVRAHIKVIGKADDFLEERGVTWTYAQQQYESNKKAHGARIRLHV